jgi:very-short-patch-repair endonuclease
MKGDAAAFHREPIERFIQRLNAATTRSPLLRLSIRSTGRILDAAGLAELDPAEPANLANAFLLRKPCRIDLSVPLTAREEASDDAEAPAPRSVRIRRLARKFETIRRAGTLAKRETGVHALWFGWPLLHVASDPDPKKPSVLAPLYLFPAAIEPDRRSESRVLVRRDDTVGPPRINTALTAWLSRMVGMTVPMPPEDELAEWDADRFASWIAEGLAAFGPSLTIDLNAGFAPVPRLADLRPAGSPALFHSAVLGIFRWQNEAILHDLESIRDEAVCPDALDGLLRGRRREIERVPPPPEVDRHLVTDADFSQQQVVWSSRSGTGLVVHGPPGTGKSQTIVNVIADALARGERVLMVCQKDAATKVVRNRLQQAGLDELCIEVHDAEEDRQGFFKTIRDQVDGLDGLAPRAPSQRAGLAEEIDQAERELDAFAVAMRGVDEVVGLSYRDVLAHEGLAIEQFPQARAVEALRATLAGIDRGGAERLETQVRRAGALFHEARPHSNPWRHRVADVEHRPGFHRDAEAALAKLADADAGHAASIAAAAGVGTPVVPIDGDPTTWADRARALLKQLRAIAARGESERRVLAGWLEFRAEASEDALAAASAALAAAVEAADASDAAPPDPSWARILEGASAQRIEIVRQACTRVVQGLAGSAWRRWCSPAWWSALRTVRALRPDAMGALRAEVAAAGLAHVESIAAAARLRDHAATAHPRLRPRVEEERKARQFVRVAEETARVAEALEAEIAAAAWARPLLAAALEGAAPGDGHDRAIAAGEARVAALVEVLGAVMGLAWCLDAPERGGIETLARHGEPLAAWIAAARDGRGRLGALASWESVCGDLEDPRQAAVIDGLAAAAGEGSLADADAELFAAWWAALLRCSVAERWRASFLDRHEVLRRVDPASHGRLVESLRQRLAKKRALEAPAILARWRQRQREVRGFQWAAVFKLRSGSKGPAMRLREAVAASCEHGLLDLRPCWLTNPAAAAQILPKRAGLFDLVVFDEASQCPLEQAIPSLYRGRRALIAGDQKQLPPTSFFSSAADDEEEAAFDGAEAHDEPVAAAAAIAARLGAAHVASSADLLAAVVGVLPERYLRVHYRSEDPALIDFSNHAFYGGRLETPPTARPVDGRPPIVHLEAGGVYDRSRTNLVEAKAVVDEVARVILNPPVPTIGVVTFNQAQRELLEDLLEERAHADPVFDEAYRREVARHEANLDVGLFVKNLENVQGDERDVMIFSTTFGPDDAGRFYRRFGPVGQVGGERRLNVAVTRAKRRVIVATSMPIEEISPSLRDLGGAGALSPPAYLQFYLAYARALHRGDREEVGRLLTRLGRSGAQVSLGGEDSPFEVEVREAVERLGYEAHPQIGDGGFRIDLAVPHRERERGYALAIECDGAAYHSDRSARIRDVWRQEILERRGWRFHRIWSRSWWQERGRELERLEAALHEATLR